MYIFSLREIERRTGGSYLCFLKIENSSNMNISSHIRVQNCSGFGAIDGSDLPEHFIDPCAVVKVLRKIFMNEV